MLRTQPILRTPHLLLRTEHTVQGTHSKGLRPLPPTPKKQIAFDFKFTVKLKLEFDFDFDLISGSNFNKMAVLFKFQLITSKFKANGLRSGPQECNFGDQNRPEMINIRMFIIWGGREVPPGGPEATRTAYARVDCTPPPGPPCTPFPLQPLAPGPGETTFNYF